jgi:hypothetical protein
MNDLKRFGAERRKRRSRLLAVPGGTLCLGLFLVNTELRFPIFNHQITRFPGPRLSPRLCASVVGVRFSLSDPGDVALCRRSRRSQFSPLSSRAQREPLSGERAPTIS